MIQIKIFKRNRAAIAARMALENNLYVPGWCLWGYLTSISLNPKKCDIVVLAFEGKTPVGILAFRGAIANEVCGLHDGSIMTFVKEDYRLQSIGTKLVRKFKLHNALGFFYRDGINGSDIFYEKAINGHSLIMI